MSETIDTGTDELLREIREGGGSDENIEAARTLMEKRPPNFRQPSERE